MIVSWNIVYIFEFRRAKHAPPNQQQTYCNAMQNADITIKLLLESQIGKRAH